MTPADSAPVSAKSPEAKAPPTSFGKGFVLDAWYFVALSRDVARASLKRHELLGEPVLIGRTRAGQVYAMRDICPHRAAPLSVVLPQWLEVIEDPERAAMRAEHEVVVLDHEIVDRHHGQIPLPGGGERQGSLGKGFGKTL